MCIINTLIANQILSLNFSSRGTKTYISITFSNTKSYKLNNFLFQYYSMQFDTDITKINFVIIYLTGVT